MSTPFNDTTEAAPPAPPAPTITFGRDEVVGGSDQPAVDHDPAPAEEVAAEEAPEPVENIGAKVPKRAPTNLEADVLTVCQSFAAGTIKLPDEKSLTPHAISKFVEANRSDDSDVSTGAVSDCLQRWVALGFARTSEKPIAFSEFVGASTKDRLNELKTERRERLAAERATVRAAKDAAKAVEKASEPAEEASETPVAEQQTPIEPNDTPSPGF